jgi:hypothetical protein
LLSKCRICREGQQLSGTAAPWRMVSMDNTNRAKMNLKKYIKIGGK